MGYESLHALLNLRLDLFWVVKNGPERWHINYLVLAENTWQDVSQIRIDLGDFGEHFEVFAVRADDVLHAHVFQCRGDHLFDVGFDFCNRGLLFLLVLVQVQHHHLIWINAKWGDVCILYFLLANGLNQKTNGCFGRCNRSIKQVVHGVPFSK